MPGARADVQAALRVHRYAHHDVTEDRTAFERAGTIVALNEADPIAGNLCNRSGPP